MKRTEIKQNINNIIYVEPNYVASTEEYDVNGLNTYEFAPPLEDYSIYVNLEVEVRGRNIQSSKTANGKKLIMSYVTRTDGSSSVNFMQGSKIPIGENGATMNSLTTNYTDLFLGDLKKNGPSTEMFGIKSIDIAYNNYMVPEVTIEFVDVRGVALFAQKEYYETNKNIDKALNSNNQEDIANTFFQCFFTFPYPKFSILVKGFYGQPVSYELTCADFRARFDSKTGNFACTAKFVGYYFSFLNDVMMNGLVAAPYSDYIGAEYWASQEFKLKGNSGGDYPVPKIGELLRNIKDIEATAEKITQSDPVAQELISQENQKKRFDEVQMAYSEFATQIESHVKETKYQGIPTFYTSRNKQGKLSGALILCEENNDTFGDFSHDDNGSMSGYYEALEKAIDDYNNEYSSQPLPKPNKLYDSKSKKVLTTDSNDETKAYVIAGVFEKQSEKGHEHYGMYNRLKIEVGNGNKEVINPLLDRKNAFYYSDNKFSSTLEKYLDEINKNIKDSEEKISKAKDEAISNAIGFRPTVENVTKIVMAHFETFARMIFKTAESICNEKPSRTIESLQVGDAYSVSDVSNKSRDTDIIVPPFPKVTKEVRRGDSINREESWVGDYAGDFREKDLVHGLINGVNEISKEIINYEKSISSGNTGPGYGGGSNTSTKSTMSYPLSPLDLIADKKIYDSNGFDINDPSSLLGLVGLRAIQIFGLTNFKDWESQAKTLGVAEAKNFLIDHKLSKEMLNKLSLCANNIGDVMQMMYGNESATIKKPGDGSQPWPWRLDPNGKGIISSGGNLDICRVKDNSFAVPFQQLSWPKIKNEIINSPNGAKAVWSNDYVNTYPFSNCINDNIFTFDTNINRFSTIIEDQLKDIENIDYYSDAFLKECKYNSDIYDKLIYSDGENLIAYIIDKASTIVPCDESCMLPTSKSYYADKTFGGGYNMNYFSNFNPGEGGEKWQDKDGNDVKRKGDNGYEYYLNEFNSRDFTFTEFSGVNPDLSIHKHTGTTSVGPATSVFAQQIYYWQEDVRARALMFLASLGYTFKYEKIIDDYICNKDITMCVIPLPSVMFIGGLLWSNTAEGKTKLLKGLNTKHYNGSLNKLLTLRQDVQKRFIKIFEKWVNAGVEGNSLLRSFNEIRSGMELFNDVKKSDEFFNKIGEIEDKNWAGGNRTWFKNFNGKTYDSISKFLAGELPDSFFRNYITIDEDVYGKTTDGTRGMRLGNRDGGPNSVHACNFALAGCVFSKNSKYFMKDSGNNVRVDTGAVQRFFDGFLSVIKEEKYDDETSDDTSVSQAADPNTTKDIKIGVYRYCKMIYDKWIAGLSDAEFKEMWTMYKFFEKDDKYFYFIDAFYNNKNEALINLGDFCDQIVSCYRNEQYSLLSFLSSVYAKNKFNFLCVQNFIDLGKKENMERMFDPVPYTEYWDIKRHPNFIVMYPYESSNYLDIDNSEYENDGFMINMPPSTTNRWPEPLTSRNSNANLGYNIPAFGVSYGKLYQSYFQDIDVSMDNPTVTEQSIKAQFAIACRDNEGEQSGDRGTLYEYGQDLYSIYSNNSYTCNVTMMGCAWVQPLMYFVLNNVPMFRGTYLIEKVSHHIEPGNMTTKFMGVRMANVCTRIAEGDSARSKNDQDGSGEANGDMVTIEEKLAGIDNDCPYKSYTLEESADDVQLSGELITDASKIMRSLMSKGYTKAQAAGIVGNMQVESPGLKPKNVICDNKGYYSGGLCMWHKESLEALTKKDPENVFSTKYGGYECSEVKKSDVISQMPDASYQIDFLIASFEKRKSAKNNILAATSPETAAFAFANYYEICKECKIESSETVKNRKKFARKFFNEFRETDNAKIAKNDDEHISKIAEGLVNALNKTAAASSENIKIGVDPDRSNGDTVLLTNAENSSRFSVVLDMILSAYFDMVESVTWVIPGDGNNINSVPVYYIVNVKEGSSAVKIYISSENNMNSNFGSNSIHVSTDDEAGIHKDFCKALYNKYKKDIITMKSDTNEVLDNYDELIKKYATTECAAVLKEAGVSDEGIGGQLQPSMKIANWDAGAAANFLIQHGLSSSKRICAFAVQQAVIAGGIECPSGGGYKKAVNMAKNGGWKILFNGKTNDAFFNEYKPSVGDVIGMTKGTDFDYVGHVCMYCGDGNGWYSDHKQSYGFYCYNKEGPGTCWVITYDGGGKSTTQKPQLCFKGKCLRR